jgi:hypothetical protein
MDKDEALKLASEALKAYHYTMIDAGVLNRQDVLNKGLTAWNAAEEALAQQAPVQPVAWREALERIADPRNTHFAGDAQVVAREALATPPAAQPSPELTCDRCGDVLTADTAGVCANCLPAYQRQPLTDEQIDHLLETRVGTPCQKYPLEKSDWVQFARAIEAAHGITEVNQ